MLWLLRRKSYVDRGLRDLISLADAPTPANVDNAIHNFRESLLAAPLGHRDRVNFAFELGRLLIHRFQQTTQETRSPSDADEAALRLREALAGSSPDDPLRLRIEADHHQMQQFGEMVKRRAGNVPGEFADQLDGVTQRALNSIPGGNKFPRHKCLSELANALEARYTLGGDFRIEDIDEAVTRWREALSIVPAHHPNFDSYRSRLDRAIQLRSVVAGESADAGDE